MRGKKPTAALDAEILRQNLFSPNSTVIIACSGGLDSVALASVMARLSKPLKLTCVLAHVNHGTRESAIIDESVTIAVGQKLGMKVRIARLEPGTVDEERLRNERYNQLATIAHEEGSNTVLTAHMAEDQTETVLLALFRGTGLDGLAGMSVTRELTPGVQLVRPLLRITKKELHQELVGSELPTAHDPSNDDTHYRRNALRERLKGLREDFPNLDSAVSRCSEIVRDEKEKPERSLLREAVREHVKQAVGLRDVSYERIEALTTAVEKNKPAKIHVKKNVEATISSVKKTTKK